MQANTKRVITTVQNVLVKNTNICTTKHTENMSVPINIESPTKQSVIYTIKTNNDNKDHINFGNCGHPPNSIQMFYGMGGH